MNVYYLDEVLDGWHKYLDTPSTECTSEPLNEERYAMIDQQYATDSHVADYPAPEPSIPTTHDSFELTEDTVIIYGQDPQQWIWTDEAVQRTDYR